MRADILAYLKAIRGHVLFLLTSSAIAAAISWGPLLANRQTPPTVAWVLFMGVLAGSGFLAWRDDHRKAGALLAYRTTKIQALIGQSQGCKTLCTATVKSEDEFTTWKQSVASLTSGMGALQSLLEPYEWNRVNTTWYEVRPFAREFNAEHRDVWNLLVARYRAIDELIDDLTRAVQHT